MGACWRGGGIELVLTAGSGVPPAGAGRSVGFGSVTHDKTVRNGVEPAQTAARSRPFGPESLTRGKLRGAADTQSAAPRASPGPGAPAFGADHARWASSLWISTGPKPYDCILSMAGQSEIALVVLSTRTTLALMVMCEGAPLYGAKVPNDAGDTRT